jgi:hypothetical protein
VSDADYRAHWTSPALRLIHGETMPKTHEMRESKFLKKEDVGRGALATIKGVVRKNVAQEGADDEMKWCLTFAELDKPFVLNMTNIQSCEEMFGSDDTDHWIGKRLVLYTDPNVMYAGKRIGGIRVRKPKATAPPPTPPSPPERADYDDSPEEDIGF